MRTEEKKEQHYQQLATDFVGQAILLRCRATVHLENRDDEWFWDVMLQKYRPGKYNYIYYSQNKGGNNTSGCIQCLKYRNYLSYLFFICIDSDYRFLQQEVGLTPANYILQTYTYSWENHYCYANQLQNNLQRAATEVAIRFDFKIFLRNYSHAIYESLLLFLFMNRRNLAGFEQKKFNQLTATQYQDGDLADNGQNIIRRISKNLSLFIEPLKVGIAFDYGQEKDRYEALGLNADNAYLHFRGHNVYNLIRSIGSHLCKEFDYEVMLHQLAFGAYWEIDKCKDDIKSL